MIALCIIVAIGFLLVYRALRRICANQVQQAVHRSNIHQAELPVLNAIRKAVEK